MAAFHLQRYKKHAHQYENRQGVLDVTHLLDVKTVAILASQALLVSFWFGLSRTLNDSRTVLSHSTKTLSQTLPNVITVL